MISLPDLPEAAHRAHIFSELKPGSLLSVNQLCDQGRRVKFTADQVNFTLRNQTILIGPHKKISSMESPIDYSIATPTQNLGTTISYMTLQPYNTTSPATRRNPPSFQ